MVFTKILNGAAARKAFSMAMVMATVRAVM